MNIEIRDLSKSYYLNNKEIKVLKNISLDIKTGDMISITGASGVGKSTFLHLLGTLDTPTSGFIFYDNKNIWHKNSELKMAQFRNEKIGFMFQFHHLMPEFSALENVMMPLLMRKSNKKETKNKSFEILSFVGLKDRLNHKPGELSGGEQQRVALARALVHEPELLLMDEPTGNLDEKTGMDIIDLIKKFHKEKNSTIVLVTHNQKISESFPIRLQLKSIGFIDQVYPAIC